MYLKKSTVTRSQLERGRYDRDREYTMRLLLSVVSIPSAPVNLQGPFDILAVVPVDSLGGDILIEGMASQFPT